MISEGAHFDKITKLTVCIRIRFCILIPKNVAFDQGLHCLPLIQQFYTHSQAVKWTR